MQKSELILNLNNDLIQAKNNVIFLIYIANKEIINILYPNNAYKSCLEKVKLNIEEHLNNKNFSNKVYQVDENFLFTSQIEPHEAQDLAFDLYSILELENFQIENIEFKIKTISSNEHGNKAEVLLQKLLLNSSYNSEYIYHTSYESMKEGSEEYIKKEYASLQMLKNAIKEKRIKFAYQPIVSSKMAAVNHYECLLRIINKDGTLSSAGPIIPIAEKKGFIAIVDNIVIDMVVDELYNSSKDVILSVNISHKGISDKHLLEKIRQKLSDPKIASRLIVEITETAAQEDVVSTKNFVKLIHDLGAKVAIDDFGAGYTSFKQLKCLYIDYIKIDGAFVKDVIGNSDNKFFVSTLVKMAEELGSQTIAEFVENGEIAKFLIDINVDFMQGNYFSPATGQRSWTQIKPSIKDI